MSTGKLLLDLTIEYQAALDARRPEFTGIGTPVGRDPEEIAADYEAAVVELVTRR
ncbi:hypothetical protein SEA_CLARK_31 [Gordonia phage Clark]|uniref:Uncharacterized protein n=1 Tax=Gordonia phage Clark TaxID=2588133 RepID=A0A4Y6EGX5_9CAUD|nr:hypothetical protein PP507_gp31 [Gordonia phage Clark]QDF17980.1 hypothetical protein SEA_CLARK_31 [Gordonia phage Clark]